MYWSIVFFLLIFAPSSYSLDPEVRSNCAEHFLNGQFRTRVLPIGYGQDVFDLECVMPSNNFPDLVETTIHNALEKTFVLTNETRTVGYQIPNWNFLQSIVESQECQQTLTIDWTPYNFQGLVQAFKVETITGKVVEFAANATGDRQTTTFNHEGEMAGIVHLTPVGNASFTAKVSASPLRCRQRVVKGKKCEFELNSAQDKILIPTSNVNVVRFSFRTDKPSTSFLRLIDSTGSNTVIHLQDGYLLNVNQISYPIRLLADGNFHGVTLNLKQKFLSIDGQESTILLNLPTARGSIKEVGIYINGYVTGIQLDDNEWQCSGSKYLTVHSTDAPLRRICPFGEDSYCQCRGPSSVFPSNSTSEVKCSQAESQNGFTLKRDASKSAFFYFNGTSFVQSVSVLFKSDASSGLVLFGQRKSTGTGFERFQVYYADDTVTAGICLNDGQKQWSPCMSCQVNRSERIGNNEWIRVSIYNSTMGTYMTVDDQICKFSSNRKHFKPEMFYSSPDASDLSYLFVGGTHYQRNNLQTALVKEEFQSNFLDYGGATKGESIRGCIGEILIDKKKVDLEKQFNDQVNNVLVDPAKKMDFFAMKRGCEECSMDCGDFACVLRNQTTPGCDCSNGFVGFPENGKCTKNVFALSLSAPSQIQPLRLDGNTFLNQITKIWALLRLPQLNENPVTFIEFDHFNVAVANYGKKVIISSSTHGFSNEFTVESRDERLHLISIEKAPSLYGTQKVHLRVDSQVKEVQFDGELVTGNFHIQIIPAENSTSDGKFGGCLEGLYYEQSNHGAESGSQINVIKRMDSHKKTAIGQLQMKGGQTCGIYDPNRFKQPSSAPFGFVSDYDPYWRLQKSAAQEDNDGFPWIVLILLLVLVLLIACVVVTLIINRQSKRTYKVLEKSAAINIEETRPLCNDAQSNSSPAHSNGAEKPSEQLATTVVTIKEHQAPKAKIISKDEL